VHELVWNLMPKRKLPQMAFFRFLFTVSDNVFEFSLTSYENIIAFCFKNQHYFMNLLFNLAFNVKYHEVNKIFLWQKTSWYVFNFLFFISDFLCKELQRILMNFYLPLPQL
jgi:hypothetical protein